MTRFLRELTRKNRFGQEVILVGERHEKFRLVSCTPLRRRKHFVTDRGDRISILKKGHVLNSSLLEKMKQN